MRRLSQEQELLLGEGVNAFGRPSAKEMLWDEEKLRQRNESALHTEEIELSIGR